MIKKLIAMSLFVFLLMEGFGQQFDPVSWSYEYKSTGANTGEIHMIATINHPWHIYAQVQPKAAVASPTKIKLQSNPLVTFTGKITELGKKETYRNDEVGIVQYQYGDKVEFVQKVTLKAKIKTNINGSIVYQACDNEKCLPAKTISFSVKTE